MDENKTNDEIFARALIQILENQMSIKKHLGIVTSTSYYDCYDDNRRIDDLRTV
jgi:hypothetical protein